MPSGFSHSHNVLLQKRAPVVSIHRLPVYGEFRRRKHPTTFGVRVIAGEHTPPQAIFTPARHDIELREVVNPKREPGSLLSLARYANTYGPRLHASVFRQVDIRDTVNDYRRTL